MKSGFYRAIASDSGERRVHHELERRPWVMNDLFDRCRGGFVVSHFRLGDEYEADFVVLHGFSGGWDVHLVELEPPAESPFNAKGDYCARLNHAAGQIRRWKQFVKQGDKRDYFFSQLRRAIMEKDLLWGDGREPLDSASMPLTDSRSSIFMHYHVIMGRRGSLAPKELVQKAWLRETDNFELITYDRVLEVWKRQLKDGTYPRPSPLKPKRKGHRRISRTARRAVPTSQLQNSGCDS
jgi:hypothetical protein